jgi:hypothetical protein
MIGQMLCGSFSAILAVSLAAGMPQEKCAPQPKSGPADQPHQAVVERGDHVMGFSHDKTTHHFRLYPDGGAIEAEANQREDTESRDAIRLHFSHIVKMFGEGNFSAPMLIHAQNPPGTAEMKRLREAIQYRLETTEEGARIRITTKDPKALRAVHEFLRFQISDHRTGDSTEVASKP